MGKPARGLIDAMDARERVANGTCGECIDCGEPIPDARLEVNPTAPLRRLAGAARKAHRLGL